MSGAEYRKSAGINWSTLKYMRESPAAYWHAVHNQRPDTPALLFGRAVHALALDGQEWLREFTVYGGSRSGNEWKAFKAEKAGKTILTRDEAAKATAIAKAVRVDNRLASDYLRGATCEKSIYWTDEATELLCKARPDAVNGSTLIELKTTTSADARRFGNEAARYGYHCQLAHYANGLEAKGISVEKIVIIAAEKHPPYDVSVFVMDDIALSLAREEVAALLQRVKECQDAQQWPGRYTEEQPLSLPTWTERALEIEYAE